MTVKEARQILSKNYIHRTDEEVNELVSSLRLVATSMVDKVLEMDYNKYDNEERNHSG